MSRGRIIGAVGLLGLVVCAPADEFHLLLADRAAIERVYYNHRLGVKPPFEQVLPPATLENLVRQDLHKEAALKKTYGVEVTPALVDVEVQRINAATRAPEMLAAIKTALGNDPVRVANAFARPILVERILRDKFDNDDKLHATQRREAEQGRAAMLAGKPPVGMTEITWQLTPRPAEEVAELAKRSATTATQPTQGAAKSASYSVEATAQVSQVVAAPDDARRESGGQKHYFSDLDPQLQNVLRVQLQKPGDVSAVIEMPTVFLVFQAGERTATELRARSYSVQKRSYEEWLAQQAE
jgi:hypothetical protein